MQTVLTNNWSGRLVPLTITDTPLSRTGGLHRPTRIVGKIMGLGGCDEGFLHGLHRPTRIVGKITGLGGCDEGFLHGLHRPTRIVGKIMGLGGCDEGFLHGYARANSAKSVPNARVCPEN